MYDKFKKMLALMSAIYAVITLVALVFIQLDPLNKSHVEAKAPDAAPHVVEESSPVEEPAAVPEENPETVEAAVEVTDDEITGDTAEEEIPEEAPQVEEAPEKEPPAEDIPEEEPDEELEVITLTEEEEKETEKKIEEVTSTVNGKYYTFSTTNRYKNLNVREGPSTSTKSIAHLQPGSKGVIIEYGDKWSKVKVYHGTISGYCINEYLVLKEVSYETYKKAIYNSNI